MKKLLLILILLFTTLAYGQSTITIGSGSSISVGTSSDLTAGSRDGTMLSTGTFNARSIVFDPVTTAATSVTEASFAANWGACSGASGYKLDVSTSLSFSSYVGSYQSLDVGNVVTYTVTGLTSGTTYYYRLRAYDIDGITGYSNIITAITAPASPVASAATSVNESSFYANWATSSGATKYYLDVSTASDFSSFVTGYENLNVSNVITYSIASLAANTTYYYRVRAANSYGTSSNSATITVLTAPSPPVAGSASNLGQTSFTANWASATGATKYYLDVATTSAFTSGTYVTGYQNLDAGNVSTYTVNTNLSGGTTYYYRVRSNNGTGTSTNSSVITVLTAPPDPVALTATTMTQTSFKALWNTTKGATKYYIDISTSSAFDSYVTDWQNVDAGSDTTITADTNLTAGTVYYYRVRALNASGTSGNSNVITTVTIPAEPVASAASGITPTSFYANWASVTQATKYYLDVSTSSSFDSYVTGWQNVDVGNVTTYSVNTNISAGTTYYYRVRAYNASGTSSNSNTINLITIPPQPTTLAATNVNTSSFSANWSATLGASGYYLDVATDNSFTSMVTGWNNVDAGSVTTYSVTGLSHSTTYYYRIRAYNAGGTSINSNIISVLIAPPAPNATAATNLTSSSFSANWETVSGTSGYYLDVSTDVNFSSGYFVAGYENTDVSNVLTYPVNTNLSAATTYYYRVRAYNTGGSSVSSNTITTSTSTAYPYASAATSITYSGFNANWSAVSGATGYRIDVSTASDFSAAVGSYSDYDIGNVLTYAISGLSANTTYYYRVRAYNSYSSSANSSAITVLTAPSAPGILGATPISTTRFTANWNASTGATGYYLDVSTVSDFASYVTGYNSIDIGNTTSYSVSGLSGGTTYYYRARAYNSGGTSPSSSSQTALTAPAAPTATAAASIATTSFSANWNTVSTASGYYLDVSTNSSFSSFVTGFNNQSVGSVTTYSVTGLTAGLTYYYRVRAYNVSNTGDNSNIITTITIPSAPVESAAISVTSSSFLANWGVSTGASGYKLYVSKASDFSTYLSGYNGLDVGNVVSYSITGLSSETNYYYYIKAYNTSGTSSASGSITATTLGTAPRAPAVSPATSIASTGFKANWSASTGATKYYLDVATDASFSSIVTGWNNVDVGNVITYSVNTGLSVGRLYYYRVRAYNSIGTSDNSSVVSVYTIPSAPAASSASSVSNSGFSANWSASTGATGYKLYVSTASDFSSHVTGYNGLDVGSVITYSITGLLGGTGYHYRLIAYNTSGASDYSETIDQTTSADPANTFSATPATSITETGFTANWASYTGATDYRLDVATTSAFTAGTYVSGYEKKTVSSTSDAVTGLTGGTTYYYRVYAYDSVPAEIASTGTVTAITIPAAPVASSSSSNALTSFTANWSSSTGASGYYIDVATDNAFSSFVTGFENKYVNSATSFSVTGLTAGNDYYYRVTAKNGSGTSAASNIITAYTIPEEPVSLSATSLASASFVANWEAVDGATAYYLDVATDAAFSSILTAWNNKNVGNVTSYTVTGLTAGTAYYYRVRSSNTGGVNSVSSDAIVLSTAPDAPAIASETFLTATGFTANWGLVSGATKYYLDVATDNTFSSILSSYNNVDAGSSTHYVITGLSSGTTYYYRVRSYNSSGTSDNSSYEEALTLPSAPVALSASNIQTTSFTANWNAVTGATNYYIDVSTSSSFASNLTGWDSQTTGNVTSLAISTGLSAGTTYYYRIRAYNAGGTGDNSNTITVTTAAAAPVASSASSITETTANANWAAVSGVDGYLLDVSTVSNFSTLLSEFSSKDVHDVTTYTITGLTGGTTYYYRVRSYTGSRISDNSNSITFLTKPAAPVASAAASVATNTFTANWGAVTSATKYYLEVATDGNFTSHVTGYTSYDAGTSTSHAITGLTANTIYYYRVYAENATGTSVVSNIKSVLTAPAAPVASTATSITNISLVANWVASTGATGYYLNVSTKSDFSETLLAYTNLDVGNVTSHSVINLNGSTVYYYRVSPYNSGGTGTVSNTITTTTAVDPSAPPAASAATSITQTGFTANWGSVTDASGYKLDVATDILFTSFVTGYQNLDVGAVTSYAITGLNKGTNYYYRVRSYNVSGTSSNSSVITVLTIPAAVTANAATLTSETGFTANWSASTGATRYYLDVATDNLFTSILASYSNLNVSAVTTYAVTGLTGGTTYYYRIRAYNASGTSENSGTITVLTSPAAPAASAATSISTTGFTANWSASNGATKYYLDVATDNTFSTFVTGYQNKDVGNVTTYALSGLTANATYYYRVRAYNATGTSGNSSVISIVGLPTAVAATSTNESSFIANWNAVTGASKYYIDVATASDFSAILASYNNYDAGNVLTVSITGLTANTTYYYRVRAYNADGTSDNSNSISLTTAPLPPAILAATTITPTSFVANWTASTSATGYYLDVATDNTFAEFLTGFQNKDVGNVTTCSITNTERGTTYYYRLRAYNSSSTSSYSSTTSVLAIPLALSATDIMQNSFSANWNTVAGVTKYYLDVATDIGFGAGTFITGYENADIGSVTTISITGLIKNTNYYYRLRSYDGTTLSASSNIIAVTTLPDSPTATAATSVTQTSFYANWYIPGGSAPGYKLDVATDSTFATFVSGYENLSTGNVLTYKVDGIRPGAHYYYRVRAMNSWGASDNSSVIAALTIPATPATIDATELNTTVFTANWTDSSSSAGYKIDVAVDSLFANLLLTNKDAGTNKYYKVTGLSSYTTYYYRVRGYNATGTSGNSNVTSVTTLAENPVLSKMESAALSYNLKQSLANISDSLIAFNPGNTMVIKAEIILSNYVKGEDALSCGSPGSLTSSWDDENGKLLLMGSAADGVYQTALRAVKYSNISLQPTVSEKTCSITIYNDCFSSNTVTRTIKLKLTNTAPVLSNIEKLTLTYLKGISPIRINLTDSLTVTDEDNAYLYSGTVSFTQGFIKTEDNIDFANTTLITGSFSKDTGILTFSGKGTVQNYQDFLQTLRYRNSSGENGTSSQKEFQFTVNDGLAGSSAITRAFIIKSPLETPVNLKASITSNSVALSWKDTNTGEGGYIIERSPANNTTFSEITRTDSNAVSYTDTDIKNGIKYYYRVAAYRDSVKSDYSSEVSITGIVVGISDQEGIPTEYIISQNYPNPFNPSTTLVFGVPYESKVKIEIYNSLGQLIETLIEETKAPGYYKLNWNAKRYASGVYIYRISAVSIDNKNKFNDAKRMTLMK